VQVFLWKFFKMINTIFLKPLALFLAILVLLSSCSSATVIQSNPPGAKLYIDGQPVGKTPYVHRDMKIVFSRTDIRLEAEGYETLNEEIEKNERLDGGALVGGLFFYIPFLWIMKYNPTHYYELTPLEEEENIIKKRKPSEFVQTKADKLRDLKELLDENIISLEEFEEEKKRILEGKD